MVFLEKIILLSENDENPPTSRADGTAPDHVIEAAVHLIIAHAREDRDLVHHDEKMKRNQVMG